MVQIFALNSVNFLVDLAAWLITPVPLTFSVLFILVVVFQWVRGFING